MSNELFIDSDDISRAVESIANPREALVGEGKKFKTDDDLARGKLHSDLYIERQKIELANEQARSKALEAELEQLRHRGKEALEAVNRNVQDPDQANTSNEKAPKMFTQEDVQKIVKETILSDREVEARRKNVDSVKEALQQTWGADYAKKLEEAANEFGGKEEIGRMAETNPKALLKLIGVNQNQTTDTKSNNLFTPTTSTVRPTIGGGPEVKGAAYYSKKRKEMGNAYFTPQAFSERLEAMTKLGNDFYKH